MHMFYTEIYLDLQAFRSPKQFWLRPCAMLGCPRDGQVYDTYVIFGIDQALYRFVGDPTGAQLGSVRDCVWMKLWKWRPVRLVVISFAHLLEVRDVECWWYRQRSFPWSIWFLDFDRYCISFVKSRFFLRKKKLLRTSKVSLPESKDR